MPNWYTHQLIAEEARGSIPVTRVFDYYFGAQGGDFMFFYRFFAMRGVSPGKILHRKNIYGHFCAMLDYVKAYPQAADYVYGYITHYAADTVFHPYVYFLTDEKGGTSMDRNITHTLIERDLDACFLERRGISARAYRLPTAPKWNTMDAERCRRMPGCIFTEARKNKEMGTSIEWAGFPM